MGLTITLMIGDILALRDGAGETDGNALAFVCVRVSGDFRGVCERKLGRSTR